MKTSILSWVMILIMAPSDIYAQQLIPDSLFGTASGLQVNPGADDEGMGFLHQSDGMIIYGGYDYDISQNDFHINMVRFDNCGGIDSSFGTNGTVHVKFDQRNKGLCFALQSDQRILVGGQQAPSNAGSQQIPSISRFNTDGSVDMSFNGTGFNALRYDDVSSGSFNSVYVMSDTRILCIGTCSGNANGGVNGIGIMRFASDGTLDQTFDGDGKMIYSAVTLTPFAEVYGHLLPNGRIIAVAGVHDASFIDYFYAIAFDPDGNTDPTYGTGGSFTDTVQLNIYSYSLASAMQNDGKILMTANRASGTGIEVVRLTVDGNPDPGFGTEGHTVIDIPGMTVNGITVLSDGKILVMGGLSSGSGVGCGVQLNSDGTIDTGFGNAGLMIFDLNNNSGTHSLSSLLEVSVNHWVAGGATNDLLIKKYTDQSNVPHITYAGSQLMSTGTGDFQWFLNGEPIPGATSNPYTPVENGVYSVRITDAFGCSAMSDTIDVNNVGIASRELPGIKIFPNPFSDRLTVINTREEPAEITLFDVSGRIVAAEPFTKTLSIDTRDLPEGFYFYEIRNGKGTVAQGKVVHSY